MDIKDIDNADISQCLMNSIDGIGKHAVCIHKAVAGGVVDEDRHIGENSDQIMAVRQV
ncbi:hypothetical protein [Pantoea agglomerans]|uniref:hypothetical protein n=1 Tax=Enterobacter agglomerans TaxID=549 RepID=UPI002542B2DA|nr:hypothetical protein [Pantoea agglomerans]MDK4216343.1 hypothetical protein [Pantoea agglomerans]